MAAAAVAVAAATGKGGAGGCSIATWAKDLKLFFLAWQQTRTFSINILSNPGNSVLKTVIQKSIQGRSRRTKTTEFRDKINISVATEWNASFH